VLSGCAVFWQRQALVAGIESRVLGKDAPAGFVIRDADDLSRARWRLSGRVEVVGIPDYESRVRFPTDHALVTCFRMTRSDGRLFVCTDKPPKAPEAIEDVIEARAFTGFMAPLEKSRYRDVLTRALQREHGLRPGPGAQLVLAGGLAGPSLAETALPAACVLLCLFFLLKFIRAPRT